MVHERGSSGKEELLLLACDGVWDVFDDQEAGEFLVSSLDVPLGEVSNHTACGQTGTCMSHVRRSSHHAASGDGSHGKFRIHTPFVRRGMCNVFRATVSCPRGGVGNEVSIGVRNKTSRLFCPMLFFKDALEMKLHSSSHS